MSTLAPLLTSLSKSVVRHAALYRATQPRLPALAPYPEVSALAATLAPGSKFDDASRAAVIVALVQEQAQAPHPLWSSLLALAFTPMLLRLRSRLRRPKDTDLDQEVVMAFLEAAVRVPQSTEPWHVAICLRRATERRVFDHLRHVVGAPVTEEFDDDRDAMLTLADLVDEGGARRLNEALDALEDPAVKELIVSTCLEEAPLGTYVERLYPTLSRAKQAAMAETLRRQRSNALAAMARRERKKKPKVEEVA
jgi:hypothetical protein